MLFCVMHKDLSPSCCAPRPAKTRKISSLKRALYDANITRWRLLIQANAVLPTDIRPLSLDLISAYTSGRASPSRSMQWPSRKSSTVPLMCCFRNYHDESRIPLYGQYVRGSARGPGSLGAARETTKAAAKKRGRPGRRHSK